MSNKKLIWTTEHQKRYNALFNKVKDYYKDITIDNYISKKKQYLLSFIHNLKDYAHGTKENMFFMIARWLNIHEPHETEWIKAYQQTGYNFKVERDELEGENQLDEKEKENLKPHLYFENILNNINFYEINNKTEHYQYLLLALLTYQPPVRTNFYITCKFVNEKRFIQNDENYIRIFKDHGKIKLQLVINKDKASNYKLYASNKSLSFIDIKHPELIKIILFSINKYPRTYLFELNNNPITENTLLQYLRNITKLKQINIDMMRSSYVSWFYENNKKYKDRDELAKQMRHSQSTASKNYFKIQDEIPKEDNEKNEMIKDLQNKLISQDYEINKIKDNNIDVNKLNKKRKSGIIYLLNNKTGYKAKTSTLEKYNIVYDENDKKWK